MVFTCIPLISGDTQHLFMCFLAIPVSLRNIYSSPLPILNFVVVESQELFTYSGY